MFSVAPASVMLIGVLGLFVVMFATTRMAMLERKARRFSLVVPSERHVVKSTV
jgi:hypothetical protein